MEVKTEFEEYYEDVHQDDHVRDVDLKPNCSDWKLSPNVECRVTLNKLHICQLHKELREEKSRRRRNVGTTENSSHSKFKLLVHELFELSSKCEEKCKLCEEFVQELYDHVIETHGGHPGPSHRHGVSKAIHLRRTHNLESEFPVRNSFKMENPPITTTIAPQSKSSTDDPEFQSLVTKIAARNSQECNPGMIYGADDVKPLINYPVIELQHVNHFHLIQTNLKGETEESEGEEDSRIDQEMSKSNAQDGFTENFLSSDNAAISGTGISGMTSQSDPEYVVQDPIALNHTGQKRFKCEQCGKAFLFAHYLRIHKSTHTGARNFKCEVCGKYFRWFDSLTKHKLTHVVVKPHEYEVCEDSFVQKSNLTIHMKTHTETEDLPYKCKTCGKCFHKSRNLYRHELTHTGVKPYECDICGKRFQRSDKLCSHKLIHMRMTPFKCGICWKYFPSSDELCRHRLSHAGMKI